MSYVLRMDMQISDHRCILKYTLKIVPCDTDERRDGTGTFMGHICDSFVYIERGRRNANQVHVAIKKVL